MPGVDFDAVRRQVPMRDALRLLGFQPTSTRGDQVRGLCPVHRATDPRDRTFSANLRIGRYRCFRCGSKGNTMELWAAVHRIRLYEAAIGLCEALGIEVPWIWRW